MQVITNWLTVKAVSKWQDIEYVHYKWQMVPPDIESINTWGSVFFCCRSRENQKVIIDYARRLGYGFLKWNKYAIKKVNLKNVSKSITKNLSYALNAKRPSEPMLWYTPEIYVLNNYWLYAVGKDWRRYVYENRMREAQVPLGFYIGSTKKHIGYKIRKARWTYKVGDIINDTLLTGLAWSIAMETGMFRRSEWIEDVYEEKMTRGIFQSMKQALMLELKPFHVGSKVIDELNHNAIMEKWEEWQDPIEYYETGEITKVCDYFTSYII